jgi:hypothetical protein
MNGVVSTGPQDPAAQEVNTDSDGKSAEETPSTARIPAAVSKEGSESSAQAAARPAGSAGTGSDVLPRKRRGILLGTGPGVETPAAADDAKSLSWMAMQAVKATNAVKASQQEQLEALKARADASRDEQALSMEEEGIRLDAGEPALPTPEEQLAAIRTMNAEEVSADAASLAVQSGMAAMAPPPASMPDRQTAAVGQPNPVPAMRPAESSQESVASPRIPAVARGKAAPRLPARMALMLGVLLMFSYAGYRHWFAGDHAAGETPATTSAITEPTGPATGVELMPPAISVVAAPEPPAGHSEAASAETGRAPTPVPTVDVPPAATLQGSEPAEPAAGPPEATASGSVPQSAQTTPAPQPAVEADVPAGQPVAPAAAPQPAAEADVPARQPVPPAPASRPQYPANGYGYYPPPTSWQPYYRPGYPQTPARQ